MFNQFSQQEKFDKIFVNKELCLDLAKGEHLLVEGEANERLYLVLSGVLECEDDHSIDAFPGSLLGLQSFFSSDVDSAHTVTALEDSRVVYIDAQEFFGSSDASRRRALTDLMVSELLERKTRLAKLEKKHRLQQEKIQKIESLALLGELSAGVAHELNNAISVIAGSTSWMEVNINELLLANMKPLAQELFRHGLDEGRGNSVNDEVIALRQMQTKEIMSKTKLSFSEARQIARLNLNEDLLKKLLKQKKPLESLKTWELGATIRDMSYSSQQATHVVRSMRELGQSTQELTDDIDVNETVSSALTMLHNKTKNFSLDFEAVPPLLMSCNSGDLIQVWTNIIKNACDALATVTDKADLKIVINSYLEKDDIIVKISNNGPKIPDEILPKIFKPNVSTKKSGHSFGLGIGLTLVQRIINEHHGTISVSSDDEETTFTVSLPSKASQLAQTTT